MRSQHWRLYRLLIQLGIKYKLLQLLSSILRHILKLLRHYKRWLLKDRLNMNFRMNRRLNIHLLGRLRLSSNKKDRKIQRYRNLIRYKLKRMNLKNLLNKVNKFLNLISIQFGRLMLILHLYKLKYLLNYINYIRHW